MTKLTQRLSVSCLLLLLFAGNALAQSGDGQYVIKKPNENHYLAHVYNGSEWVLQDATEFSPDCLWYSGREYNNAGTNHNYYFFDGTHYRFLAAPLQANGTLYLSASVPETYLLNNTDQDYYFYNWDSDSYGAGVSRGHRYEDATSETCQYEWKYEQCWEVYWVELKEEEGSFKWEMSPTYDYDITSNSGMFRSVTATLHSQVITAHNGGLTALSVPSEMEENGSTLLGATVDNYSYTYIPQYTTYGFEGGTHNYCVSNIAANNGDLGSNTPVSENGGSDSNNVTAYLWSISGDGASYLTLSDTTVAAPTLSYSNPNTEGNKTATVTLTVTYRDGATQTLSASVLVKTTCQSPAQALTPIINYNQVTVSWYPTADSYKVYWQKNGENTWHSETTSATSFDFPDLEFDTAYNYKVAAFCGGTEQDVPSEHVYSFTTQNAPVALIKGNVFGGGRMADVHGKTEVFIINTDGINAVFGGNDIAGAVQNEEGSTIILGVEENDTIATKYNNGAASTKVRIGDVYGGGNGYYAYNGSSFEAATDSYKSQVVENGAHVNAMTQLHEVGDVVWTNNTGANFTLDFPSITKTTITVTNDAVTVDSIFGGAKNAFLTNEDNTIDGTSIEIKGGTIFAVFGGNNFGGTQKAGKHHIVVSGTKTNTDTINGLGRDFGIGYLFGGGNKVEGLTTDILITGGQCDTVFAGGNAATVAEANVTVNCLFASGSDATFGKLYSQAIASYNGTDLTINGNYPWDGTGIYNVRTLFGGNNKATMYGLPTITLNSGSVGTVYGGGNAGDMKHDALDDGAIADDFGSPIIQGVAQPIKYGTHVKMSSESMFVDNLYGGCQMSNVEYSTWVEIENGHVGYVYGGCNISGDVGSESNYPYPYPSVEHYQYVKGATYVKAAGGTIYKNLIAGSNGYYHCNDGVNYIAGGAIDLGHYVGMPIPTHNETHVKVCDTVTVKGNVYAGGNMAPVGFIDIFAVGNQPWFVGLASVKMTGGTVEGNVFGGGNMASIYGSNEVNVSGGTIGGALYGGNDQCGLVAQITNRALPDSYGLASDPTISLNALGVHTYVGITGKPQINTVYGGGNGAYDYESGDYCNPNDQPVQSNTFVDINLDAEGGEGVGGRINTVYGGGNGVTITGGTTVLVNVQNAGENSYAHVGTIFGGNNMGDLAILPDFILLNGRVDTIYGGCNAGAMTGSFTVEGYEEVGSRIILRNTFTPVGSTEPITLNGVVSGAVYGGCRMNNVESNTLVLIETGEHSATMFGGCDVSGEVKGTSQVIITGGTVQDVYGGGNGNYTYGEGGDFPGLTPPVSDSSQVLMLGGSAHNLYAGGFAGECGDTYLKMVDGTANSLFGGGNMAGTTNSSTVDLLGGTVSSGIFGGCNNSGDIEGDITVNILSNVGSASQPVDIFGGGYGKDTETSGDVIVNIGAIDAATAEDCPVIYGDIYGGSSLGNVNDNASDTTRVNFFNGTLHGNVYGGGLGDKASLGEGHTDVAAKVNGKVLVNIGDPDQLDANCFIDLRGCSVFGGNNTNGSPQDDVTVNIYRTAHDENNAYPYPDPDPVPTDPTVLLDATDDQFAIQAVYGGGNLADYAPANATNTTTVHIWQCRQNTVKDVFGGSNQASAQNTCVIIDGGRIDRTFGGGNGQNGPAPVVGTARTEINAGLITQVFGGSNTNGNVGNIELEFAETGCPELINEVFNGSNEAPLFGDIVTDLIGSCDFETNPDQKPDNYNFYGGTNLAPIYGNVTLNVYGGYYINVFGGSKGRMADPENGISAISADIKRFPTSQELNDHPEAYPAGLAEYLVAHDSLYGKGGNVTLNIYGGKIVNAFGGSDVLGDIEGKITVNVLEGGGDTLIDHCDLDLFNVYGSGNITEYNPKSDVAEVGPDRLTPEVNILDGTVKNNVFGGGLGATATVTANPVVTIGDLKSGHESYTAIVGRNESGIDYGNVYGGGELAQVAGSTSILIQKDNTTIKGTVYGGGMGIEDDPSGNMGVEDIRDAGLVTGNATVEMTSGNVQRSIYGGGELGSVGTFIGYWAAGESPLHVEGEPKPNTCQTGTGKTTVLISGGRVGMNSEPNGLMPDPSNPTAFDDYGYVFCASKGLVDSITYPLANLLAVVNETYLEISGSAVVTASAYGGSENGQVLGNTYVKVDGGQIGLGHYKDNAGVHHWDPPYTDTAWTSVISSINNGTFTGTDVFHQCDAWPFNDESHRYVYDHYATYGPDAEGNYYYDAALTQSSYGGSNKAGNGHSFFGNIFGGGSGYYPIAPDTANARPRPIWRRSAGRVCGDTYVEITGGHILTNVYGGNEITDVLGKSTVVMTGGTLGVPRSLDSIQARPVNSYLFGAGMGDPRILFNGWSNVNEVEVTVGDNAVIFGSVFGGGEDGHVLNDVTTTIEGNALIGTLGTSSVDGNIFGGGRGFTADALTAGVVCGNINLTIKDNVKILGSVYGGGRLAAVGTYLAEEGTENYGVLQPGPEHGNITINITGGTIGNEYQMSNSNGNSIGDVFGGSRGTLLKDVLRNQRLGLVKNTSTTISGDAHIYGSVYGGGGLASVGKYNYATQEQVSAYNETHTTEPLAVGDVISCEEGGHAIVTISGGTIGKTDISYPKGHVFGSCLGMAGTSYSGYSFVNNSSVTIEGGAVYGSVFGGGENGHVLDSTLVSIDGGTIGIRLDTITHLFHDTLIYRGNVYGGGRGIDTIASNHYSITAGKVSGNTHVRVTGGTIYRNVYGGGSLASVGDPDEIPVGGVYTTGWATVNITGGQIGTDGGYHGGNFNHLVENGHVFGSGRGVAGSTGSDYIHLAYVKDSKVIIGGTAYVTGSVFGSGENGHVRKNTRVTVQAGTGTDATTGEPYPIIGYPLRTNEMVEDVNDPKIIYRGNVYGGGRGIDHTSGTNALSATAGVVEGNTNVIVSGGTIRHNVYGGGSLARVGNPDELPQPDGTYLTGHATVNISGGQIGMSEAAVDALYGSGTGRTHSGLNNGQVYGSARGIAGSQYASLAFVKFTQVNISGGAIFGSVFGGGANGHVRHDTEVNISGGAIGITDYNTDSEVYRGNVYGGGRGIDHDEDNHNITKTEGAVLGNSNIHITGGTVYHNVYGGGSLASVGTFTYATAEQAAAYNASHPGASMAEGDVYSCAEGTGIANILIEQADGKTTQIGLNGANNGRVFGSGRGYPGKEEIPLGSGTIIIDYTNLTYVDSTSITFNGGTIKGSIFGSGDNGHVFGNTRVVMNGGFLGNAGETNPANHDNDGNIFGGGRGSDRYGNGKISPTAGHVGGNTYVEVNGGTMLHNIYGGGHMASVGNYTTNAQGAITGHISGGDATIVIKGGTIGIDSNNNGRVFGAGRGAAGSDSYGNDYTHLTYVNNTYVNILNGANIKGCVFGSGDNGHTLTDTHVTMTGGTIGTTGGIIDGNIFGGGHGQDPIAGTTNLSITAGKVYGDTYVTMTGGNIKANIYGGGNMSTVAGTAHVEVDGSAIVGVSTYPEGGKVFGASRGDAGMPTFATVNNTIVDIAGANVEILSNVYGGGENGAVNNSTDVTIAEATLKNVYGAGQGVENNPHTPVNNADVRLSTNVTLVSGTVNGSVYGGGEFGSVGIPYVSGDAPANGAVSTVNIEGGHVLGSAFGGGNLGFNKGQTIMNLSGNAIVDNNIFGGAYGSLNTVYVAGLHTVNMRGGTVYGNVYGGSRNADDALAFNGSYSPTETGHVSVVNISGGHAVNHVFASGYFGKAYGSVFAFIGTNAIMNAPDNTFNASDPIYNANYYNDHTALIIDRDVWAGADYGDYTAGQFGEPTISGQSDIYVDGLGYDTENALPTNNSTYTEDDFMVIRNSIYGCGTSCDAAHEENRHIMVRNYGKAIVNTSFDPNSTTFDEPFTGATRDLFSIQRADNLVIENSNINFIGQGKVNSFNATEKYTIHEFNTVRVVNNSTLVINKPLEQIKKLGSYTCTNVYASSPTYDTVSYLHLNPDSTATWTNNKFRVNQGTYISVIYRTTASVVKYGELEGYFYMMTEGTENTFAFARPKQSAESGNGIASIHDNPHDGGFVSYHIAYNAYDITGAVAADGIQIRYENHAPNRNGEDYFRVWRYANTGVNHTLREGVLNAVVQTGPGTSPNNFYLSDPVRITLPPSAGTGSYYKIQLLFGAECNITYGSEYVMENAALYDNEHWMYIDKSTDPDEFHYCDTVPCLDQISGAQAVMVNNPNNAFGLVAVPVSGLEKPGNDPWLICNEAADEVLVGSKWYNNSDPTMPEIDFYLTYSNRINGNNVWEPVIIFLEQYEPGNPDPIDEVEIRLTITTITDISQPITTQTYALMFGDATAPQHETYTTKILLPAYTVQGPDFSQWTLTKAEWKPNAGFNQSTLVNHEGNAYVGHTDKVGMTINPSLNFDNSNGWHNNPLNIDLIDISSIKMNGTINPLENDSIWLGETDGRNPISFNVILYYDAQQKVLSTDTIGTVELTMNFNHKMGADTVQELKIYIEVLRKGDGGLYYIDGVNGSNSYSGLKPDAAKPNLASILYFTNFSPGDVIYIVDKITIKDIEEREWNGQPYDKLRFYRYDGGHPVYGSTSTELHYTGYNYENLAYLGPLVDVKGKMTISSSWVDGSYTGTPQIPTSIVKAHAPLINVSSGGELTILGGTIYHSDLVNNYNDAPTSGAINGGAINIESGGSVKINNYVYIEDNYVKGALGGGVYLEGGGSLLLSDLVTIDNNKKMDDTDTIAQNVYLENFNTNLSIGTQDPTDIYGPLDVTSKVGITKTSWNDTLYYMPVAFGEDGSHLNNLHYKDILFDDQGLYRPEFYEMADPTVADPVYHLFFVETWTTVVHKAPNGFNALAINTPEELAWAISLVNGLNEQTATPNLNFTLTDDIDMSAHIWDVIGNTNLGNDIVYSGIFKGNGHTISGIHCDLTRNNMGLFGKTMNATISDLLINTDFEGGTAVNLGALAGDMVGGTVSNVETAGILKGKNNTENIGGIIGKMESGTLHSSFAVNTIIGSSTTTVGGLVGNNGGDLYNAYSNVTLHADNAATTIGGLAGINSGHIENCYAALQGNVPSGGSLGWFANINSGTITYCYSPSNTQYIVNGTAPTKHGKYSATVDRKHLDYMYRDNAIALAVPNSNSYVPNEIEYYHVMTDDDFMATNIWRWNGLLSILNQWVDDHSGYTPWFRPTTKQINDDLPVLAFPTHNSLGTTDGKFLRYGSTAGDANGIDALLTAFNDDSTGDPEPDAYIFLYGHATGVSNVPTSNVNVFINEDACLIQSGTQPFINTTVGVTFDNSSRNAPDYLNNRLEYDWHLLSTPLSNAKIGATYSKTDSDGGYIPDQGSYQNSPVDIASLENSYFPNGLTMGANLGPDEVKWDFYNYFEPEYHWINLKRNKKNHFHQDAHQWVITEDLPYLVDDDLGVGYRHYQIQYNGTDQADVKAASGDDGCFFTPGKGYMMAISQDSYMNSTGTLNNGSVTIPITATAPNVSDIPTDRGSNLVGNPYQAYLDLDNVETTNSLNGFWIYDADQGVYAPYKKNASVNPAIPSQYIHPHQGFFVVYKPADDDPDTKTLTFNYDMIDTLYQRTSYFRGDRSAYPLVNLYVFDTVGNRDLAVVEFNRPETGGVKKVENLQNAEFKLYAHFEDEDYGLLFTPKNTARVPVFFKTPNDGTYTLHWNTFNGTFTTMRLIDNLTGVNYDMLTNDHYTFQANATDYAARFYIVFNVNDIEEQEEENQIFAYFNGSGWVVEGEGQLELIDMLGHVLYADHLDGKPTVVHFDDFAAGVYMLRLVKSNRILKAQKIVIE